MSSQQEATSIVVLGSGGVGKSALTIQFIQNIFVNKYDPTIEDSYRKVVEVDGKTTMLEIIDTAGNEQFTAMRDLYIKNGQCFAVVYSVTSTSTFNNVSDLYEQIIRMKEGEDRKIPIILVGNKCDMYTQRIVTTEQGADLAAKLKCNFLEASAKSRINVDEIFMSLVRQYVPVVRRRKPLNESTMKGAKKNKTCQLF